MKTFGLAMLFTAAIQLRFAGNFLDDLDAGVATQRSAIFLLTPTTISILSYFYYKLARKEPHWSLLMDRKLLYATLFDFAAFICVATSLALAKAKLILLVAPLGKYATTYADAPSWSTVLAPAAFALLLLLMAPWFASYSENKR